MFWLVWFVVMVADTACHHYDIDEDFDDSFEEEEFTMTTPSRTSVFRNCTRMRRSGLISTTRNEYEETEAAYVMPTRSVKPPDILPASIIHAALNIPSITPSRSTKLSTTSNSPTRSSLPTLTSIDSTFSSTTLKSLAVLTRSSLPTRSSPNRFTSKTPTIVSTDLELEPSSSFTYSIQRSRTTACDHCYELDSGVLPRVDNEVKLNEVDDTEDMMIGKSKESKVKQMEMPQMLEMMRNLAEDYDWSLSRRIKDNFLRKISDITGTYSTTDDTADTTELTSELTHVVNFDAYANARVISKCFVCGLTVTGVPQDSNCADAFAGDFIPLVPVDPKARSYISKYRKYCRFMDVAGSVENVFEPRSVFGRFTGGCSVRWVDLTGIYTQRTCRNRRRPVTGKHFASKRMAKLERALHEMENGCIISPMATLLPMSRQISLYARFHACVCTGEWCNAAEGIPKWMTNYEIVSLIFVLFLV